MKTYNLDNLTSVHFIDKSINNDYEYRRGIKIFGIRLRKEGFLKIISFSFEGNPIEEFIPIEKISEKFIVEDKKVYNPYKVNLKFILDSCTKEFKTEKEAKDFYLSYVDKIANKISGK